MSPSAAPFRVEVSGAAVRPHGEFDVAAVHEFEAAVAPLRAAGAAVVTLELHEVDLIDSAALGAILRLRRDLHGAGRTLHVVAPRPFQRRLFRVTGLDALLWDGQTGG